MEKIMEVKYPQLAHTKTIVTTQWLTVEPLWLIVEHSPPELVSLTSLSNERH